MAAHLESLGELVKIPLPGCISDPFSQNLWEWGAGAAACCKSSPGDPSVWPVLTAQYGSGTSGIRVAWELFGLVESQGSASAT